jgi:hypothetical protein
LTKLDQYVSLYILNKFEEKMDVITHTCIAVGCIAGAFYVGRFVAKKSILDEIVTQLLAKLEDDGFIHTKKDKDGDKELVPISELIEKYKKTT